MASAYPHINKSEKRGIAMETVGLLFGLPPIFGLAPLLLYILLAFKKGMHPVVNVVICVVFGAILVAPTPLDALNNVLGLGKTIYASLGSFLALVGLIIMLGSGLGMVLRKTGVAENIVNMLMRKIGVKTQKRAIVATMMCSVILVTLLGTLAGANAVIAPIVIPLVAAVGITPSTLAIIFMGAGQTGLFLGPFTPPMVTLMGITGLSYPQVLLSAGLPIAVVMWAGTFWVALRNQKKTAGLESFGAEDISKNTESYVPSPNVKRATTAFLLAMAVMVGIGIVIKGGAAYVIFVMLVVSVVTGLVAKMNVGEVFDNMMEGCGKLVWLFFMFIVFDPFLNFVVKSGAFDALVTMLEPTIAGVGKVGFALLTCLIGVFGINGAAVAQALMIDQLFSGFLPMLNISPQLWAVIVLVGHQITSYAYPGVDMIGAMGLAHSKNVKAMLRLAYTAIIPGTILVSCLLSLIL